jgi:hypothetical protein
MKKSIIIFGISILLIAIIPFFSFSQNVGIGTTKPNTTAMPDIYQHADMRNGQVILATSLKVGEQVKLIYHNKEETVTVRDTNEGSFAVDNHYSGRVFVYGRVVGDFSNKYYKTLPEPNISDTSIASKNIITRSKN